MTEIWKSVVGYEGAYEVSDLANLTYGTVSENRLDAVRHGTHNHTRRTHCYHGHLLDGVKSSGTRFCKSCRARYQREYRERQRQRV